MPAVIHPDTTASVIADLRARVAKLETYPGGGMNVIASAATPFNTNSNYAYLSGGYTTIPDTLTTAYTLLRPTPILLVASMLNFLNGGTATFCLLRAVITSAPSYSAPGLDTSGAQMLATAGVTSPSVNGSSYVGIASFVCPAGTWNAAIQYEFVGGATTTLTNNSCGVTIYRLPG